MNSLILLGIMTVVFVVLMLINFGQLTMPGFGGIQMPTFGGGAQGGVAEGGKPTKGRAYRSYEGDIAAVDTLTSLTAFGGNTVSTQVPKGAQWLDSMDIGLSLDAGAAVISVRAHVQVQLLGQGFRNSPHQFGGPAVSVQGITSGNAMVEASKRFNNLAIGCVEGGDATIQGVLIGEDPGDVTLCVTLGYFLD